MILNLDLNKTIQRFEAWWLGDLIDRPPVTLTVLPKGSTLPYSVWHPFEKSRWMDVKFVVESAITAMSQQEYLGDTFPIFWPNLGPEITATLFGCELEFTETTSWSNPIVNHPGEWQSILDRQPNFENPYWQTIERMTDYAIELSEGRYLVGITDLHGNYDILAALRDPMHLAEDLIDCPDLLQKVAQHVSSAFVKAFQRLYAKVSSAGFGSTTWLPFYHKGPAYVLSCDFWCMVSSQMAQKMILPSLMIEMQPLERTVFHLDCPNALKHLELVLELPGLNAVQWVYGAGNGPAGQWIKVYQRILEAGKSIQVLAYDAQDAITVLKLLGPKGVWLNVELPFQSSEEAKAFLEEVERISIEVLPLTKQK